MSGIPSVHSWHPLCLFACLQAVLLLSVTPRRETLSVRRVLHLCTTTVDTLDTLKRLGFHRFFSVQFGVCIDVIGVLTRLLVGTRVKQARKALKTMSLSWF